MTDPSLKIELLRLAKPDVSMPDVQVWLDRAKALERYVLGEGQPETAPREPLHLPPTKSGQPSSRPGNPPRK